MRVGLYKKALLWSIYKYNTLSLKKECCLKHLPTRKEIKDCLFGCSQACDELFQNRIRLAIWIHPASIRTTLVITWSLSLQSSEVLFAETSLFLFTIFPLGNLFAVCLEVCTKIHVKLLKIRKVQGSKLREFIRPIMLRLIRKSRQKKELSLIRNDQFWIQKPVLWTKV